jgi:hypothetical protein
MAYRSYLLRVWRADNDGRPVLRFTLQPTDGGPAVIFNDPDEFLSFLDECRRKRVSGQ